MRARSLSVALLLASCAGERHPKDPPLNKPPLVVQVTAAQRVSQTAGDEVVGTVRARNVSAISSSVMGHVSTLTVTSGSKVRAGQLLVKLSAEEITAKLGQADASFAQAEVELKRAQQLVASQTIPNAHYEVIKARYNVAKEVLAEANVMRGYTVLRAPFSGVITEKMCEVGDLATPGKPLLILESLETPQLEAHVPEISAQGLEQGQKLSVRFDSLPQPVQGTVSELSPSADPVSRTVLVKVDLPDALGIRPGMFGRLQLESGESSALLVPSEALVRRGQLELVFVARDGRAALRIVRTSQRVAGKAEVLSGLSPGEQVVISRPQQLADGQLVEVRP